MHLVLRIILLLSLFYFGYPFFRTFAVGCCRVSTLLILPPFVFLSPLFLHPCLSVWGQLVAVRDKRQKLFL